MFGGDASSSETQRASSSGAPPEPDAPRGSSSAERIGRHYILGVLGEGGMGIVYDAYDPELDRRIAIKVLSRRGGGAAARERLLAEAQAMARVSHPNVVQVYDVGTYRDQVYVAMERLEGGTLGEWLARADVDARAIIKLFAQAGRGLAAAHATGLVHQDFKPDNVLIDSSGRPRVLDFGIARLLDAPEERARPRGRGRGRGLAEPTGGTPAYMAPEQFAGRDVDARADQFAFCVALYEALAGARPFPGETVLELAVAVNEREPQALPSSTGAPRFVARALRRGLSRDPAERFPAMEPLLAELSRDPAQTRRRVGVALAFGAAMVTTGALVKWQTTNAARCTGQTQLDELWNDGRAEQITASLRRSALPYADENAQRVRARLDEYARGWKEIHLDNCQATRARREQSEAAMDLRLACLHHASQALAATVAILADADDGVAERAQPMVDALPELARCDNLDALKTEVPEPSEALAPLVDAARAQLASAAAARVAGRYELARERVLEVEAGDITTRYGPLETEVALAMAAIERERREHAEAERWIDRALASALRWSQWSLAGDAAVHGMVTVGSSLSRPEEAMKYAAVAEGLGARSGTPVARAELASAHGAILRERGRYRDAEPLYQRALELLQEAFGLDSIRTAAAHINLAACLKGQARYDEAADHYARGVAIYEAGYGATHPKVVSVRAQLAGLHNRRGEFALAERELRWVVEQRAALTGGRGPDMMRAHLGLASVLIALERYAEAEASARAAIEVSDSSPDSDGLLATAYNNLGNALELQGELAGAEEVQLRALELQRRLRGDDHPSVAITRSALGLIIEKRGDYARAEREQRAALTALEATLGPEHPTTANVRSNLGSAVAKQGRAREALELQRAALAASRAKLGDDHPQTREIEALARELASRE